MENQMKGRNEGKGKGGEIKAAREEERKEGKRKGVKGREGEKRK